MITVGIPIGPFPSCKTWLEECIISALHQLKPGDEILLVLDYTDLPENLEWVNTYDSISMISTPWRVGVAHAFNFCVSVARNDLVVMLGSDDVLLDGALEACRNAWRNIKDPLGYYWFPIQYSDGEQQALPCNAAMVHKKLWDHCGGFPIETATGAMDAALVSIFMVHPDAGHMYRVCQDPIYWVRRHPYQDTSTKGPWQGVILETRDILAKTWKKPTWTNR